MVPHPNPYASAEFIETAREAIDNYAKAHTLKCMQIMEEGPYPEFQPPALLSVLRAWDAKRREVVLQEIPGLNADTLGKIADFAADERGPTAERTSEVKGAIEHVLQKIEQAGGRLERTVVREIVNPYIDSIDMSREKAKALLTVGARRWDSRIRFWLHTVLFCCFFIINCASFLLSRPWFSVWPRINCC